MNRLRCYLWPVPHLHCSLLRKIFLPVHFKGVYGEDAEWIESTRQHIDTGNHEYGYSSMCDNHATFSGRNSFHRNLNIAGGTIYSRLDVNPQHIKEAVKNKGSALQHISDEHISYGLRLFAVRNDSSMAEASHTTYHHKLLLCLKIHQWSLDDVRQKWICWMGIFLGVAHSSSCHSCICIPLWSYSCSRGGTV